MHRNVDFMILVSLQVLYSVGNISTNFEEWMATYVLVVAYFVWALWCWLGLQVTLRTFTSVLGYLHCESKNFTTCGFLIFFPNDVKFLIEILHTYYTFTFTLNYKILFSSLQLWQSYTVLSMTTQWIFTFHNACVQTNGHQIHLTSTHLTTICRVQGFRYFTNFTQSQRPLQS